MRTNRNFDRKPCHFSRRYQTNVGPRRPSDSNLPTFGFPTTWRGCEFLSGRRYVYRGRSEAQPIARGASDTRTRTSTHRSPSMTSACYTPASARVSLARTRTKRRARNETATPRETLREATIVPRDARGYQQASRLTRSLQAHTRAAKTPTIYMQMRSSVAATMPRATGVSFASKATSVGVVGPSRKRR